MSQQAEKKKLRDRFLAERRALTPAQILEKSLLVHQNLEKLPEFQQSKVIFCYISFPYEVSTQNLIEKYIDSKKIVTPATERGSREMKLIRIKDWNHLERGPCGFLQPKKPFREFEKEKVDLTIVPGLVFDKEGYRLGFGGGFYDVFLKDYQGFSIGLTFEDQLVEKLPQEEWDIAVNKVVTEKQVL